MILHKNPNNPPPFRMWNGHPKLSIYQLLLLIDVYFPSQGINIILIFTFPRNTPTILFPNLIHSNIQLFIQVRISLLHNLVLQHICRYIHFITKTVKDRKITPFTSMQGSPTSGYPTIFNK